MLTILAFMVVIVCGVGAVPFVPYGPANQDATMPRIDDHYVSMTLTRNFQFLEQSFGVIKVSTNGLIFFDGGSTSFTPQTFPRVGTIAVAAYWVDSDPRRGGDIFYRQTNDPGVLNTITNMIRARYGGYDNYVSDWAVITTFENVAHYGCSDCSRVINHQTILTTDGVDSFVMFLYDRLDYGGALIGFNAGDGVTSFMVPGYKTGNSGIYALANSNVDSPGEWIFSVARDISEPPPRCIVLEFPTPKVLYVGNQDLFITGPCFKDIGSEVEVKIGSSTVTCKIIEDMKLHCITPYINSIGSVDVEMSYLGEDLNGTISSYNEVDSTIEGVDTEVTNTFDKSGPIVITWDETTESSDTVGIRGMQQNICVNRIGKVTKIKNYNVYVNADNTGSYDYEVQGVDYNEKVLEGLIVRFEILKQEKFVTKKIIDWSSLFVCKDWFRDQLSNLELQEISQQEAQINPCSPTIPSTVPETLAGGFQRQGACLNSGSGTGFCFESSSRVCYRSTNNPNGYSVQCCYKDDFSLIVGPSEGGSLDTVDSGKDVSGYIEKDVVPWWGCCKFSNDCRKYYKKRPSVGSA